MVKSRAEARHWIELRHTGENLGAGTVRWVSDETARFKARTSGKAVHVQALDFLENSGALTPEQRRKVPVSSFKRLLGTPEVREKVGIDFQDGQLKLLANEKLVEKALLHVVNDLLSGKIKTKKIYNLKDRLKYAENLPSSIVVQPDAANGGGTDSAKSGKNRRRRGVRPKKRRRRDRLIPDDCMLGITDKRLTVIENELRTLDLEDFTNAIAVLFRVFLELSVDAYIDSSPLGISEEAGLSAKMRVVADDLVSKARLTKQQAVPVRRACQRDSFLAPSIDLMHKYVHSRWVFPAPGDLRAHWNNLQPFVIAIWSP